ncbi:MAG: ArdC family protein [Hyphomicrobiaceae bacterium]
MKPKTTKSKTTRSKAGKPRTYDALKPRGEPEARQRLDVHEAITQKIVAAIEAGAGAFEMPWHRPGVAFTIPKNALTEKPYKGSNVLSLWIDADVKKYEHQVWATYKQWEELGAQVRKGEKGSLIIKYGEWVPKEQREQASTADASDDEDQSKRLYAKPAWVFNVGQVDGFTIAASAPRPDLTVRLAHVDAFIAATGAEFREGGQRAFYRHRDSRGEGDFIQIPERNLFSGTATSTPTEAYESTRLHELGHWSGADHRLARDFGRFGDHAYAFEELVAELSAAYLCAGLEITNTPRIDHAQYIANWLEVLKGDTKAIFTAASLATKAVDYLYSLQPNDDPGVDAAARPDVGAEEGHAPARPADDPSQRVSAARIAGGPRQ